MARCTMRERECQCGRTKYVEAHAHHMHLEVHVQYRCVHARVQSGHVHVQYMGVCVDMWTWM